jgi:hypothetical protein
MRCSHWPNVAPFTSDSRDPHMSETTFELRAKGLLSSEHETQPRHTLPPTNKYTQTTLYSMIEGLIGRKDLFIGYGRIACPAFSRYREARVAGATQDGYS